MRELNVTLKERKGMGFEKLCRKILTGIPGKLLRCCNKGPGQIDI
jgi:hypothetical protein